MNTSEATSIGGPAEAGADAPQPRGQVPEQARALSNPETAATAPVLRRSGFYVLRRYHPDGALPRIEARQPRVVCIGCCQLV